MRKRTYTIGSVSSGTMRHEDLIPAFAGELRWLAERNGVRNGTLAFCRKVEAMASRDGYYGTEDAHFDLEELFDRLQEFAPPYFYFGSHPGDGADYGFWLPESFLEDYDGLKVRDLSEVPRGHRGEVLEANDRGNLTLWRRDSRGRHHEIWAIV